MNECVFHVERERDAREARHVRENGRDEARDPDKCADVDDGMKAGGGVEGGAR